MNGVVDIGCGMQDVGYEMVDGGFRFQDALYWICVSLPNELPGVISFRILENPILSSDDHRAGITD